MVQRKWIYGGAGLLLAGLIVWAAASVPETPAAQDAQQGPRIMSYEDNTLHEERDGRTVWKLTARQVRVDIDTNDTGMQGIEGTFYSDDGRSVTLHADEGHMASATRDITLTGNVHAEIDDGTQLRADSLVWTAADGVLAAVGGAALSRSDVRASGDRIASADAFQQFSIQGNAQIEKTGATK